MDSHRKTDRAEDQSPAPLSRSYRPSSSPCRPAPPGGTARKFRGFRQPLGERLRLFSFLSIVVLVVTLVASGAADRWRVMAAEGFPANDATTWHKLAYPNDLRDLVEAEVAEIVERTKASSLFSRGRRRLEVNGHVVALLGNIGTMALDGEDARKAATLRAAGLALAVAAQKRDYDAAKKAVEIIRSYPDSITADESAEPAPWSELVPSATLMKKAAAINSASGAINKEKGRAFTKGARPMAKQALLLAYLAIIEREREPGQDWKAWCDKMFVFAIRLAKAYDRPNQTVARDVVATMTENCEACHRAYRAQD